MRKRRRRRGMGEQTKEKHFIKGEGDEGRNKTNEGGRHEMRNTTFLCSNLR